MASPQQTKTRNGGGSLHTVGARAASGVSCGAVFSFPVHESTALPLLESTRQINMCAPGRMGWGSDVA